MIWVFFFFFWKGGEGREGRGGFFLGPGIYIYGVAIYSQLSIAKKRKIGNVQSTVKSEKNVKMAIYSQLLLVKKTKQNNKKKQTKKKKNNNVKMAIYSQLSSEKKKKKGKIAIYNQNGYYLSYNTGKRLFYY